MRDEHRIQECFSEPDWEFAFLPPQVDAALEWVSVRRVNDLTWADARCEIEAFLSGRQADKKHIRRQIERAKVLIRPWLT